MSADYLGLYDTPAGPREVRFSITIVVLMAAAALLVLPIANMRLPEVAPFVPVVNAVILLGDVIIAAIFSAQAIIFRSRSLTVLAAGYLLIGLLLIPQALTFPGAFSPEGLFGGGTSNAAWFAVFRRLTFPFLPILYVLLADKPASGPTEDASANVTIGVGIAAALFVGSIVLVWAGQDVLPPLFLTADRAVFGAIFIVNCITIVLSVIAIAMVFRKRKCVLDLWLLVASASWLIQSLMNLPLQARFTAGWYALYTMMLVSNLIILVALIAESNRLYAKLALTNAARSREQQAERMSIDAVAAALSHEVGQPLTALSLNATAAMASLRSQQPNVEKAIGSISEIQESARRSFDVLRSIRSMLSKEPGWASETDLNELIRDNLSRLDQEMAAARITVGLELEKRLPPIMGNSIQLQQVVGNLLVNAVESLDSTRGRRRRIVISSSVSGSHVLLQIADNGPRLSEDETWHVFDAFQGNESDTKGIRLSLCRTIVEEHGGRIWVTPGEKQGSTFHVELPIGR